MTYIKKLLRISLIEAKTMFRSVWSIIYFVPIIVMTYLTLNSFWKQLWNDNAGSWINQNGYITVYMSVILLIIGVYSAHQDNDIMEQILMPVSKNISKLIGLLIFSQASLLIPIIVIVGINFIRPVSLSLLLNHCFYVLLQWFLEIFFFSSIGFSLGIFIKNKIAYYFTIIPAVLFSMFLSMIFYRYIWWIYYKVPLYIFDLFNTNVNNPAVHKSLSSGFSFNTYYSLDMMFIFLLALVIICFALFKNNIFKRVRNNKALLSISLVITALLCLNIIFSKFTQPIMNTCDDYYQNVSAETVPENKALIVKSIKMNVNLKEKFTNDAILKLKCEETSDSLALKLDTTSFKIDDLKINGKKTDYNINGCHIYSKFKFEKGKNYNVECIYHGRVNYADESGVRSIFVDNTCSYIPEVYDWYPQLVNGKVYPIEFDLKIKTDNKLVSNLSKELKTPQNGEVSLSGKKNYIFISTGYYTNCKLDGINVIVPEEVAVSKDLTKIVSDCEKQKINEVFYTDDNDLYQVNNKTLRPAKEVLDEGGLVVIPASGLGSKACYSFDNIYLITE